MIEIVTMKVVPTEEQTLYIDEHGTMYSMTKQNGSYLLTSGEGSFRVRGMEIDEEKSECEFALQQFEYESDAVKELRARFDVMTNMITAPYGEYYFVVVNDELVCRVLIKTKENSREHVRLLIYSLEGEFMDKKVLPVADAIKYVVKIIKSQQRKDRS